MIRTTTRWICCIWWNASSHSATFGVVTQIVVNASMPESVRTWLVNQFHGTERDLYVVDGPLALDGLVCLLSLKRPDLLDPPLVPASVTVQDGTTTEPVDWDEADVFSRRFATRT